jgi:hypothetical protein
MSLMKFARSTRTRLHAFYTYFYLLGRKDSLDVCTHFAQQFQLAQDWAVALLFLFALPVPFSYKFEHSLGHILINLPRKHGSKLNG